MVNIDREKLIKKINNFKNIKALVIGDMAIDEMIYGDCERISREAPVLILQHSHTKVILGGASNAANNLSKLNEGHVKVIGVCGDDYHSNVLIETLNDAKIDTSYMIKDKTRKTIVKTRISGSCSQSITQQIVRIDRQTNQYINENVENSILKVLEKAISEVDVVILSDYHICTLTKNIINKSIEIAKKYNKIIVADAQKNLDNYKGVTSMTPNQPDTEKFVGYFIQDDETLNKAGFELLDKTNAQYVLVTRGEEGMAIFDRAYNNVNKIPAFNKTKVFDVTGAGDTVVAAYSLALASGLTPYESAFVANIAASIVIREFGCATTNIETICEKIKNMKFDELEKSVN